MPPALDDDDDGFIANRSDECNRHINEVVKDPLEHDVLCGRGGSINSHPGNERFRRLVEKRKKVYLTARFKREKRLIAGSIVSEIRNLKPPGRFLNRDAKTGMWKDIGDEKARDKTSQALRENAPTIRAEIETEINEQRAEMQREEEVAAAQQASVHLHPPPYYPPWGYSSYYGSYPPPHHAPPPPPHGHVPPPHPGYHAAPQPPPPPPDGYWSTPYPGYRPDQHYGTSPIKSAVEQTAEAIASGAESLKNWTKANLSMTGSMSSHDNNDNSSLSSKPISYVHKDGASKAKRMVKFRDDGNQQPQRRQRMSSGGPSYSPLPSGAASVSNSLVDNMGPDMEPHDLNTTDDHNSSLMTQVANQILGSFGSWDAGTFCGDHTVDERIPFPKSFLSSTKKREESTPLDMDEDMGGAAWEGQEVQLVDNDAHSHSSDERMPPPVVRPRPDMASSVGLSSLGSCHSWLPEQFGSAASYFSFQRQEAQHQQQQRHQQQQQHHHHHPEPLHSMDMEYSAHENYSAQGSLGGGSLTRVFEHGEADSVPSAPMGSPRMNNGVLNQMPSWERSLRSKSPLSVGSEDDVSLISRTSSKISDGGGHLSNLLVVHEDDMVWESGQGNDKWRE